MVFRPYAHGQMWPLFTSGFYASGSPDGFTDTNFWSSMDQISVSEAYLGFAFDSVLNETYYPTNPASPIELQFDLGIIGGGPIELNWTVVNSTNAGSGKTENTQTTDLYVAFWYGLFGCVVLNNDFYTGNLIEGDDTNVLNQIEYNFQIGRPTCYLRRNGDGSPNPLAGAPQVWAFCLPSGTYHLPPINEPQNPFSPTQTPFDLGGYAGSTFCDYSNYWLCIFSNVPPGNYTFYAESEEFFGSTADEFFYDPVLITNALARTFTFDPEAGPIIIQDEVAIESPVAGTNVPVGQPVPIHITLATAGFSAPRNWKSYALSANGVSITNQIFDWNTTTDFVDTVIDWIPPAAGSTTLRLVAYDTEYPASSNAPVTVTFNVGPTSPNLPAFDIVKSGGSVVLSWTNVVLSLQSAPSLTGPFTNIVGSTSPYTVSISGSQQFFRLVY